MNPFFLPHSFYHSDKKTRSLEYHSQNFNWRSHYIKTNWLRPHNIRKLIGYYPYHKLWLEQFTPRQHQSVHKKETFVGFKSLLYTNERSSTFNNNQKRKNKRGQRNLNTKGNYLVLPIMFKVNFLNSRRESCIDLFHFIKFLCQWLSEDIVSQTQINTPNFTLKRIAQGRILFYWRSEVNPGSKHGYFIRTNKSTK